MTRMLAALLAIALLALSALSLTSPASAQIDQKAKQSRQVSFLPKNVGNKSFIYGEVEDFKNKTFTIQRKVNKGPWKAVNKVKTSSKGTYKVQVFNNAGTECFRAQVPGSGKYKPYTTPTKKLLCFA